MEAVYAGYVVARLGSDGRRRVQWSSRPVFLLGHGCRAAGVDPSPLLNTGVPILTSWNGKDLVDNWHRNYYGSTGVYGQRAANRILYEADQVITVGCRAPIWTVGYSGIRPDQRLLMVDCDESETKRFAHAEHIGTDIESFVAEVSGERPSIFDWAGQCDGWRVKYPWLEAGTHNDADGFINSYGFTAALEKYLRPDEVIITDAGCCMCPAFQVLRIKPPQRLITSGGLGEMGSALPGAIGASFARNKGQVICIVGDGGFMLNIQELQTIVHHQLPIKIIVYRNEGYAMIRHSQNVLGMKTSGVSPDTGLSFPDFVKVGEAFGIQSYNIRTWEDFEKEMPFVMMADEPSLIQYWQHPLQRAVPKLNPIRNSDGTVSNPEFWNLDPQLV